MNFIQKTKTQIHSLKSNPTMQKIAGAATASTILVSGSIVNAGSAGNMIATALGYVATIFFWLGIFFAVISFVQLLLALKREDAEAQSTQIRNMIIGIVLTASGAIINKIYQAAGGEGNVTRQDL